LVRFWDDRKDIKIAIGETLSHFSRRNDLVEWVRSDQQENNRIAELIEENKHLRSQLQLSDKNQNILRGSTFEEIKAKLEERTCGV